nr:hypothetical protein [uncultured Oscillibacter sp.]
MEALNRMISQHNRLGGAELTVHPSGQDPELVDIRRGGRELVSGLTYEQAVCVVSALDRAKRQDIEAQLLELGSLLEAVRSSDDCLYDGDVEREIAALTALLNG